MKIVLLVILILLVACGGISAVGFYLLTRPGPPGPPGNGSYNATLSADSYDATTQYMGRSPTRTYWMIVNATMNNTGTSAIPMDRTDWRIDTVDGFFIDFPSATFYSSITVFVGGSWRFTLVFDLTSFAQPAKISATLPDGARVAAFLS